MQKSSIVLTGIQVKNLEKAKRLAYALNIIEEECGIRNVMIRFKDVFICPWIDFDKLDETEMECLIRDIFKEYGQTN